MDEQKLANYEKKKSEVNFKRFMELTNYDFNQLVIKKNVGDEARTFNLINQSKPLLSPSRISKVFTEHIFWNIPKRTLLLPRLRGQLVHRLLELWLMSQTKIKLDNTNFEDYVGGDIEFIKENWSQDKINTFIDEVNEAVNNIYNYLNLKKIKVIACEKYVADKDYHGYIDLVAYKYYSDNGCGARQPMIIDLKITSKKEIISSYYLQLSLYRHLYEKTSHCFILFYDVNTKEARLEKAQWSKLDETFNMVDTLNKFMREE